MSPSPIVDHEVLDPLELAHLDGSPTVKGDFANGSFASILACLSHVRQTRRPEGFVARSDAGSQTAHAGDRRARQQDGADHLGATCKAAKLQSSGRSQGVSLADLRSSQHLAGRHR